MGDWHTATSGESTVNEEHQNDNDRSYRFSSRRSPVLCRHACVATSQPLASSIGLNLLRQGANAAETSIAIAAALAVLEPCSTGLGGDMFCLHYDGESKQVSAINGSGASPESLSLQLVKDACGNGKSVDEAQFQCSAHAVTVPGAARGWEDLFQRYGGSGKFSFHDLLEPAAILAEEGFPVSPVTAHHWKAGMAQIKTWIENPDGDDYIPLTVDGRHAPRAGEIFRNPDMARVLRELGKKGASDGFYNAATGQAIVNAVRKHGACMTMEDLKQHTSTFPTPIFATYRNVKLWQVPPNGQGIAGLIALAGLQHLEKTAQGPKITPDTIDGADALHVQIEMMRLGFLDAREHVADPDAMLVSNEWLLDTDRIAQRAAALYDPHKAVIHGEPLRSSCTVSFQVVDMDGNAVSFVNSNFMGFGTGIVPDGCGFTLQNRGFGFTLEPSDHPNVLAGGKRPYHTIIPGMLTYADTDELYATLSNMGGNMQPQGHLQLTVNMVAGEMDPQKAVDRARFCIASGTQDGVVHLETGVSDDVVKELGARGHRLWSGVSGHARSIFGRAQIIKKDRTNGVLWAGSDGRADGCAMGF